MNCPRRDAQCEVKPRTSNKFISCRPSTKEKETSIKRNELPEDEELANCRRGLDAAVDRIDELQSMLNEAEVALAAFRRVFKYIIINKILMDHNFCKNK